METIDHIFVGCRELIDIRIRIAISWDVELPDHFTLSDIISWYESVLLMGGQ